MKKTILVILMSTIFAQTNVAYADIKETAPNEFDCTIDELELHVAKRTENLRKESAVTTWEDFKVTAQKAKSSGSIPDSANGDATSVAAAAAIAATGSGSGEEDDCPLFFEDFPDIDTDIDIPDFPTMADAGDALAALGEFADKQMTQLGESLINTITAGFCERMSTEYLTNIGMGLLDDTLDAELGYTTSDITGNNFENRVLNDALVKEYSDSNAKLLNVADPTLNDNREAYFEKQRDAKLDDIRHDAVDNLRDSILGD